jgi:hypothetical protein
MTDHDQGAFEAALQADLSAARQQNLVLADQLRAADARNEAQAHRIDWLTGEVARVTASREQYERVAIRVSAKMEAATSMVMGQLAELQEEIREAAFTQTPGADPNAPAAPIIADNAYDANFPLRGLFQESTGEEYGPATPAGAVEPASPPFGADFSLEELGDFIGRVSSASLLPPARLGNGVDR